MLSSYAARRNQSGCVRTYICEKPIALHFIIRKVQAGTHKDWGLVVNFPLPQHSQRGGWKDRGEGSLSSQFTSCCFPHFKQPTHCFPHFLWGPVEPSWAPPSVLHEAQPDATCCLASPWAKCHLVLLHVGLRCHSLPYLTSWQDSTGHHCLLCLRKEWPGTAICLVGPSIST